MNIKDVVTITDIINYKVRANQDKGLAVGPDVYGRLVRLFMDRGVGVLIGLTNEASKTCMNFYLWNGGINPIQCGIDTCGREDVYAWVAFRTGGLSLQTRYYESVTDPAEVAKSLHDWITDLLEPQ